MTSAAARMTATEAKLFLREPMAVFWVVLFPAVLLGVLGAAFPGFTDPSPDFVGRSLIEVYTPIVLGLALATVAFTTVPVNLATYRELGVLRRLSTTPVHPRRLLTAQMAVLLAAGVVGSALAVVVAVAAFDVGIPDGPGWFLVAFLLAAVSLLALGLLIGAVAPRVSTAQGIGMTVYFPMLFLAGVYFPREVMPTGLQTASDLSPIGAAVQSMSDAWVGNPVAASDLVVMAVWAVVGALLAVRFFRWQ